jgi:hypothetical protein
MTWLRTVFSFCLTAVVLSTPVCAMNSYFVSNVRRDEGRYISFKTEGLCFQLCVSLSAGSSVGVGDRSTLPVESAILSVCGRSMVKVREVENVA